MQQVAIAGLGLLGSAIADRLRRSGYVVVGYDPHTAKAAQVDQAVASVADLAERSKTAVLCLPDSKVTATIIGHFARPGMLVIDTTTGTPAEMASFGAQLHAAGARYLDCTVAASSVQVRRHDATVMVGGAAEVLEKAAPILVSFAQRLFHVGPWGAGARMKLVVNLALGLQRAALSEALGFAEAAGIDERLALEILKESPAYSRAMDMKGTRMLDRRYAEPDARLRQHHKDVRLILEEGTQTGARLPLTKLHEELLEAAEQAGWGDLDNSVVRELFRKGEIT